MKIVVCVKWVGALGDDVEFNDGGTGVDPDYLLFSLNEWDACATEEALRLRDAAGGGEVVVATVGGEESERALRHCLAMGADRAVRVAIDDPLVLDPLTVGRLLSSVVRRERADIVLCGAQSSDATHGATGPALAAFLDVPCVTVVTKVELSGGSATVRRELEAGLVDITDVVLPAVLTIQTGINEPRYVTHRALQQAQRSDVPVVEPAGYPGAPQAFAIRSMAVPASTRAEVLGATAGEIAARIAELVREATR